MNNNIQQDGFSLVELLISTAIAAFLVAGLVGVISLTLNAEDDNRERNDLTQQVRFAMQRMVAAVSGSQHLLLPLADNPATDWPEQLRVETVPASAPEGSSTKATAVLAISLDPTIDRDADGWADANNDKDFLDLNNNSVRDANEAERIDEDIDADNNNDGANGIVGIDDDGDGVADEGLGSDDNDEDGSASEDYVDQIDNDNDGMVDEDIHPDMNKDFSSGIAGVDDDYDGLTDEAHQHDDDEDGVKGEDWFDSVVYYLNGNNLIERLPAQSDINGDTFITGADFTESVIAENVFRFRVERIVQGSGRAIRVDLTLELKSPVSGEIFSLQTQVRVGGGL